MKGLNDMENSKNAFEAAEKKILEDKKIIAPICARCGEISKSNHLYYIIKPEDGGQNRLENLIPLCDLCESEKVYYELCSLSVEEFLAAPNAKLLALALTSGYGKTNTSLSKCIKELNFVKFAFMANACETNGIMKAEEYEKELKRQNEIFSRYNYSNPQWLVDNNDDMLAFADAAGIEESIKTRKDNLKK